jgi:insertion element IS1 protein InsB
LPDHLQVQPIVSPRDVIMGRLQAEADEMWSFVKQKTNRQWVWLAMDNCHGQEVYRTQATFYTDPYDA